VKGRTSLSISTDGIGSFKEEEGDFVGVEVGGSGKTRKERGWRWLNERGERELFFFFRLRMRRVRRETNFFFFY
jgi:hypothetical protein